MQVFRNTNAEMQMTKSLCASASVSDQCLATVDAYALRICSRYSIHSVRPDIELNFFLVRQMKHGLFFRYTFGTSFRVAASILDRTEKGRSLDTLKPIIVS